MFDIKVIKIDGLHKSILDYIETNKIIISEYEDKLFNVINDIISISVNQKDGFVTISANMPESEYAANMCINARELLQESVINKRIKSAKQKSAKKFSKEKCSAEKCSAGIF